MVSITDPRGLITHVNELFCRISKYPVHELVGKDHRILNSGCHEDCFWRNLWETLLSGRVWKGEIKNRAKDGTFYWVDATLAPSFDPAGHLKRFLGIYTEISPWKEAEESLRRAQRLDSLRVMAGGIAHDFNNLLTSILGNCGILTQAYPPESQALPFLDNIEKAVQRAALLTNQMLAFTGRGPWLPILLDLNTFVKGMEKLFEASCPRRIAVRVDVAGEPLLINADPSQLHQILVSLVNNAAEAIGEEREGAITVRAGRHLIDPPGALAFLPQTQMRPGAYAVLEVADSGCGMTDQILSRIFDPFFTTKFTGRGLGLSAVLGILRAWEGGIAVDSVPGGGSVFRVYLPLVEAPEGGEAPEQPASLVLPQGKVLFVDDEPMLRQCASEILMASGFEVVLAEDGLEALECYRTHADAISIIVMDLSMPHLNGVEAATQIRELDPRAKVILSSGYTSEVLAGSLRSLKPDAFLHKPYTMTSLRDAVLQVLLGATPA
ncbi:response regulator [Geothrix sp. 21YS21S-2]|uniref:hybrid sensor histidine kinase/response regulator n=1 Tax=Geothrix sp. 21YS21S-2 TaxID=3068893 RepID=UPI0027B93AE1|nr:response regulator [Geothrix sp. 21YS21S-2]